MPTTTERLPPARIAAGALLAFAIWVVGIAAAALVVTPDEVVVVAPGGQALRAVLASNGLVVARRAGGVVTARSRGPRFVAALYANGAWFVWPALSGGCLALRS